MKSFKVYYAVNPNFGFVPSLASLDKTHRFVKRIEAKGLEEVFFNMQGEVWSPNGEARELIRSLGLKHTSMSVGDVVVDEETKKHYVVDFVGFSEI